jgi:uncharacterized protein YheU (UPF0270 family)
MTFWSSLEVSAEAALRLNHIRKQVDKAINVGLTDLTLATQWGEWTFIVTMFAPNVILDYQERVRRNNKRNAIEFSLRANYGEFMSATPERQADIFFEQLHRTVDLMAKYKVSVDDRVKLHDLLDSVRPKID